MYKVAFWTVKTEFQLKILAKQVGAPLTSFRAICRCFLLIETVLILSTVPFANAKPQRPSERTSIAKLPISFEPNLGQIDRPAKFRARAGNIDLGLRSDGIDLTLGEAGAGGGVLALDFVHANPKAPITASERKRSETNYLFGRDPFRWHTHIPNFGRVTYADLYPGISLAFYGNGQQLEHDFVVSPGGDYHQIRMRIKGSDSISIDGDGSLKITRSGRDLRFERPDVYQNSGNEKVARSGQFVLRAKNEVGFEIASYDPSRALVIDPILNYSTYLANLSLYMSAVATDSLGDTFVIGQTFDANYPSTPGAFQQACKSCSPAQPNPDLFVTKLNPNGSEIAYSTYLGGSDYDQAYGIVVDGSGNAIVVGRTQSTDFPVKNAIPVGYTGYGNQMGFVTSLSADGSSLNYSSLLGGANTTPGGSMTVVFAVALDASGNAYVTGVTNSLAFPATPGAINAQTPTPPALPYNLTFVAKFFPNGALGYNSLIGDADFIHGGGGTQGPAGIAVDSTGAAYIGGGAGPLWPTTSNAYQTQIPAPFSQAIFVAKVSSDGSNLVYSTFLSPSSGMFAAGEPTGMALNAMGEVFVTGWGAAANFPTTGNAFQPTLFSGLDASFISELSSDGSHLVYSSFFQGLGELIESNAITIDAFGNIWIGGITQDPGTPLVHPILSVGPNLFSSTYGSSSSGFVARFDPSGAKLTFSTFLPGDLYEGLEFAGIAADPTGKIHVAGTTGRSFYTTPGATLPSVTPPPPNNFYTYGFVQLLDSNADAPSLCLTYPDNTGINFSPNRSAISIGTSPTHILTIQNCGTLPLSISSIRISDLSFTISTTSNACLQSVAPNASCTLPVVFAPLTPGVITGVMTIASNASVPTVLPLVGLAAGAARTDFAFSTSPASEPTIMIPTPGDDSAPVTLVIAAENGYAGTVNFASASCSIVPAGSGGSCAFSSSSIIGSGSTDVMIHTVGPWTARLIGSRFLREVVARPIGGSIVLACSVLVFVLAARRTQPRMVYNLSAAVVLIACCGCGGPPSSVVSTPPPVLSMTPTNVVYTVTVTATSGQLTHNASFAFSVQ